MQGISTYTIKSKNSNRYLDICQDTSSKGMLTIYDYHSRPNQQFYIKQCGLEVELVSKQSGKSLTIAANSNKNGAPVFEEPLSGLQGQRFRIQETVPNSGEFVIYTFCGKVLDCCEGAKANGTKVIQWEFNGGDNQKWIINQI